MREPAGTRIREIAVEKSSPNPKETLEKLTPLDAPVGRFQATDPLLRFLASL
jgi:hypothetical protein